MDEEQGSRSIGSLLPRIVSSLAESGSTRTPRPTSSATTGVLCLAPRPASSTGRGLSATDAEQLLADKVASRDTAAINNALVDLLSPFVSLSWRGIPTDDPFTTYAEQRLVVEDHYLADDRPMLRRLVEISMLPARRSEIIKWLGRLRALTAWRGSAEEGALVISALADELAEWPADAVLSALGEWPRKNRFWPTLAELLDEVRRGCKTRIMLLEKFGGSGP
jgi:hypothetical protein